MPAVPGDAARVLFPLGHQDPPGPQPAQFGRGGQAGRAGPDDDHVGVHGRSRRPSADGLPPGGAAASSADTVAAQ